MIFKLKKVTNLTFFLGFYFCFTAFGNPVFELDGYMGVSGGESFNYNIKLHDSLSGILSGYSYTYKTQDKTVKTYLSAEINKSKKTLHIKEQSIIYNHGFKSRATICLVDALLSYDSIQGILSGSLITRTINNGRSCSTGSISFIYKEQINKLFSEQPPVKEKIKSFAGNRPNPNQKLHAYFNQLEQAKAASIIAKKDLESNNIKSSNKQVINNNIPNTPTLPQPKKITEGKDAVYFWNSDKIILTVWDGSDEDGDRISILYNGKTILNNYTLKNKKREFTLSVGGNELNNISIIALNEGNKSPNTANITIQDGNQTYPIIAYNLVGKKAVLKIKKQ